MVNDDYTCTDCATGWYKSATGTGATEGKVACTECLDNCDVCTASACTTCTVVADNADGFKNDGDGTCSACPTNCNTCTTAGVCTLCHGTRYVTSDGDCDDCPDNCTACTAGVNALNVEVGICSACLDDADNWVL
jgi:hypothetical protein